MLILPIVNKSQLLNVQVRLKDAKKSKTMTYIPTLQESDIIVNGRSFLTSDFSSSKDSRTRVDFIRNNLVSQNRTYSITTKIAPSTKSYDVYEVITPPPRVSPAFDDIYSRVVLDMQKETPNVIKSKYLSLKRCGLDTIFTDENIRKVKKITTSTKKKCWPELFQEEGLTEMIGILGLMPILDCTIIPTATISLETISQLLNSLDSINSKDTKNIRNYYNMAQDNSDIYARMIYVSKLIYDKPYDLIQIQSTKTSPQLVKSSEKEMKPVA